jgi:hypothetical protein
MIKTVIEKAMRVGSGTPLPGRSTVRCAMAVPRPPQRLPAACRSEETSGGETS